MGLLSFIKGQGRSGAERADASAGDTVQAARARARRRLIGAAVLLGIGVLGFPLLFETQPRPIAVDIPIEIPRKEAAPSLPLPPPRVASAAAATARVSSGVITQRGAEVRRDAAPLPAAAASRPEAAPRTDAAAPAASAAAPKPAAAPRADDGGRARALLEGKPAESAPKAAKPANVKAPEAKSGDDATVALAKPAATDAKPDAAAGRYVVQVGAFSEAASARNMRQRVEQLGFKCYTQTVEVDGVKRIRVRVGPFAGRDEAEKAAVSLKAAGLTPAVLTL
jgi:DedD protein